MRILVFWDIYWKIWRLALKKELSNLKEKYNPDFIIANIDNITSWRWPIEKHILEMEKLWIDFMTGWDHIFDNLKKIENYLSADSSKILFPANLFSSEFYNFANKWYKIIEKNGKKLLIIHLLWEVFMRDSVYNPFLKVDEILKEFLSEKIDWIIVDFHKEVTSEIKWMWFFLDGRVSFVYWTHTHVQTNDETILENWTWYISDLWMNWASKSVIWADFESVKKRFLTWINRWKINQSTDKNYLINWVFVEIWKEKKCEKIEKIRINWFL